MKESITLYYRAGNSDKVYTARIEPRGDGFIVNASWGRRGATMQSGSKTQSPVPYHAAKEIYDSLVKSKTAKGYSPGPDGMLYVNTNHESRATGILPQLLNAVDEDEVKRLLGDGVHWMQQKIDGKRLLIRRESGQITGINRRGLVVVIPEQMDADAKRIDFDFVIDGEALGDELHAFDILYINGVDTREFGYMERYRVLDGLLKKQGCKAIKIVPVFKTAAEKKRAFGQLKKQSAEGVVFKLDNAPYMPGRPASGGVQLKYKFYETASCIVAAMNGKRSVALELFDAQCNPVPVGNVTVPVNQPIPAKRAIVEVRYLYAFPNGGSLFQPVLLGIRDDIEPSECVLSQLKLKALVK